MSEENRLATLIANAIADVPEAAFDGDPSSSEAMAASMFAERLLVGGVVGEVIKFLGGIGLGFDKDQILALVDKAIDAAIAAIATRRPLIAGVLNSPKVRELIRNLVGNAIDGMFPSVEV